MVRQTRKIGVILALLLLTGAAGDVAAADDGLLRPPGLEPEIGFWRDIFIYVGVLAAGGGLALGFGLRPR